MPYEDKREQEVFYRDGGCAFYIGFGVGGAGADIDTALEGAKKIGEKAEQIEQIKKPFQQKLDSKKLTQQRRNLQM